MFGLSTGFILFDLLVLVGTILLAIYVYFKYTYEYWARKGVPFLKPTFPYGNNIYLLPKSTIFAGEAQYWYADLKAKGHKFGGVWSGARKVLVLIDPDYIKDIMTSDFHHFIDRDSYCDEKHDPYFAHLFNIPDPSWRPLRQKLTPLFTSGKMKLMFHMVTDCAKNMINFLAKESKMGNDINLRDVLSSFTTDVIGTVAFGLEINSFEHPNDPFREQSRRLFQNSIPLRLIRLLQATFPEMTRTLGIVGNNPDRADFFISMVKQTMEYRTANNIRRNDFIQMLMEINVSGVDGVKPLTFEQIVANTILFFIAGFDTSSSTMTFTLYELARNPEIQEKVREEIKKVLNRHDDKITYESLTEMTYLQQCMDEAMRKFPPLITLSRICTKNYQLKGTDVVIEKGTPVVISTLGQGMDSDHFPDPEKYDPDRFTPEAKQNRHPYAHLPFGEGPRNCIGLRFGLMQSKIGLIQILSKFKLSISPKTKLPLTIDEKVFLIKSKETLYVRAESVN